MQNMVSSPLDLARGGAAGGSGASGALGSAGDVTITINVQGGESPQQTGQAVADSLEELLMKLGARAAIIAGAAGAAG